jgi:hypothetical protein
MSEGKWRGVAAAATGARMASDRGEECLGESGENGGDRGENGGPPWR